MYYSKKDVAVTKVSMSGPRQTFQSGLGCLFLSLQHSANSLWLLTVSSCYSSIISGAPPPQQSRIRADDRSPQLFMNFTSCLASMADVLPKPEYGIF